MFFLPSLLLILAVLLFFSLLLYKIIRLVFQIKDISAVAALRVFFVFLWLSCLAFAFFEEELLGSDSMHGFKILLIASYLASIMGIFTYWILKTVLADD
ncbi:hypothetical protein DNI29_04690 [Hymenobacter sediminis]|uniref:hypothetical protein n=1 Tax=Hymenobacter sediminis TaxID=2218621 RepID=UPI000DA6B96E|nr:hypothetical protein [Hymenobacter sediminis]RPD50099.1 hypothetical protein DNI29_04690 [Hymenobacter sediminis]